MNVHTGEVKAWDQLSEAEKQSGEWMPITPDQVKKLRAGETTKDDVVRQLLAPTHPESGLPIDAKPQAHRRAIVARRALSAREREIVSEILPPDPETIQLARGVLEEPEPGDVLSAIGGVTSVR